MGRYAHIAESFAKMCTDPSWGVPSRLYLDNGGEYNVFKALLVNELLHLAEKHKAIIEYRGEPEGKAGVTRSIPHSPQGKIIEGVFSNLERNYFSIIPGYIGGNRHKTKAANKGKKPEPFPGNFADFESQMRAAIDAYHATNQEGHLNGATPNEMFNRWVRNGWGPALIIKDELNCIFAETLDRTITRGTFPIDNVTYTSDALIALPTKTPVTIRRSYISKTASVWVFDKEGKGFLGHAAPDRPFSIYDPAGAKEQRRRETVKRRNIKAKEIAMSDIVPIAALQAFVAEAEQPLLPSPIAVIGISDQFSAAASSAPPPKADAKIEIENARREQRLARNLKKHEGLNLIPPPWEF